MAFYCGQIALHTVEENDSVMIYGPVIMNAEVICYKGSWKDVRTLAVSQGRSQEIERAYDTYPQIKEIRQITQKAILYSVERGEVDGAIQDITKAAEVPDWPIKPLSETDAISYVMVVDKDFAETEAFRDYIRSYNAAVEKLNDKDYLAEKLDVDRKWLDQTGIGFLTLKEPGES